MKLQLEPLCEHLLEHLFFGKPINTKNGRRAAEFELRSALRWQHEKIGGPSVAHSFVANKTGHVITNVVFVVQLPIGTEMIDDGCCLRWSRFSRVITGHSGQFRVPRKVKQVFFFLQIWTGEANPIWNLCGYTK